MTRAYGLRIAIFAIFGLLLGVLMTFLMQPKYEAIMQVLVDQSATSQSRMMTNAEQSVADLLQSPRPRTVATQVEQMTGFGVLSRASQAVHQKYNKPYGSIKELDLIELQNSLSVEAANMSDIIALRVRMPDKELAKDILNEIYLAFDAQNQEASREVGARALT
ncbi:MAG: Wzz/FepE/Etk N-terminal domain-containing protein, partial [Fimbriimonas sp.]